MRSESTLALSEKEKIEKKVGLSSAGGNKEEKVIVSYWGIQPSKITKKDGTEWKWNCAFEVVVQRLSSLGVLCCVGL